MVSEYIVCYLSESLSDSHSIEWFICDDKGNLLEEYKTTPLAELSTHLNNRRLIAIAPAYTYVIHQTDLPLKTTRRLQSAIPYALEEQLSDPIENLHFAIFPHKKQASRPFQTVVVIDHTILKKWLSLFSQQGLKISAIIPDLLCMPETRENHCNLLVTEKSVWITLKKDDQLHCFYTDRMHLKDYLTLLFKKYPESTSSVHVYHPYHLTRQELAPSIPLEQWENQIIEEPLMWFTQHYLSKHELNDFSLLQGAYRPKGSHQKGSLPWYTAGILSILLLLSLGLTKIIEWKIYQHQDNQLQQRIRAAYFEIFPKATEMISPKIRLEQFLKSIQKQNQEQAFFKVLAQIAKYWNQPHSEPIIIQNISYHPPILSLQLEAASLSTLDEFTNQLKAENLSLKQVHAGLQNGKASMELQILNVGEQSS